MRFLNDSLTGLDRWFTLQPKLRETTGVMLIRRAATLCGAAVLLISAAPVVLPVMEAQSTPVPAAPAPAQAPPSSVAGHDVVVTGRDKQARNKQIRDFVRSLTPAAGTGPLARYDTDALCPQAAGLGAHFNKLIAERMRAVAAAARIRLARDDCRDPNAAVIFTDDKAATVRLLLRRYPGLFHNDVGDPIPIAKEAGPALAWHVSEPVTRDGARLGPGVPPQSHTVISSSRIQATVRPVFTMAVVVIERAGVDGLTATQIADYAAMRAFTDASPDRARKTGAPTILTVLEAPMGSETPLTMTAWDFAFLRGLYDAPKGSMAAAQRGAIGTFMRRKLDAGEAVAPETGPVR